MLTFSTTCLLIFWFGVPREIVISLEQRSPHGSQTHLRCPGNHSLVCMLHACDAYVVQQVVQHSAMGHQQTISHAVLAYLVGCLVQCLVVACRHLGNAGEPAVHLLGRLLAFDPARRCSAEEALAHEYLHCFEAIDLQFGELCACVYLLSPTILSASQAGFPASRCCNSLVVLHVEPSVSCISTLGSSHPSAAPRYCCWAGFMLFALYMVLMVPVSVCMHTCRCCCVYISAHMYFCAYSPSIACVYAYG